MILPEDLKKAAGLWSMGDEQWFNIVRRTLNAMLETEEYGITKANVDEMMLTPTSASRA